MKPVKLSKKELEKVISLVTEGRRERGAARVCRLLAGETEQPTGKVCQFAALTNISNATRFKVNPRIAHMGLFIACERPLLRLHNRFGEKSEQHLWSFYRMPANHAKAS